LFALLPEFGLMTVRGLWRAIALMGVVALVASTGTRAQDSADLAALRAQVSQLFDEGKYADAVPIAERYVASTRKMHGEEHTEFATAIDWLANVYKAQGRYHEAEPLYERALAIREKAFGAENPEVAQTLNNLAELYLTQGRYAEAEPLNKRSLAIRENALGVAGAENLTNLRREALAAAQQGDLKTAEQKAQRYRDLARESKSENSDEFCDARTADCWHGRYAGRSDGGGREQHKESNSNLRKVQAFRHAADE
jgi:tetratricopeptide (TPR) repeat protein